MSQRLKRWESPRKEGRNDKGKGGSARQRQLKKRTQMLRQKLKDQGSSNSQGQNNKSENRDSRSFLLLVNSPSTIHHSPFTIHHSPFTIHHPICPIAQSIK